MHAWSSNPSSWCASQAKAAFGEGPKAEIAENGLNLATKYVNNMPIGWNINDGQKQFEQKLTQHLRKTMKPQPSGFLFAIPMTVFFYAVISGIISWVVRRILDEMFKK